MFAVWSLSEKHSIYIELLLRDFYYQIAFRNARFRFRIISFVSSSIESLLSKMFAFAFAYFHSLLYILIRIIEHRKSFRKSCHSKDLDLSLIQNDKIYFVTYYFFRFDDRLLNIQMLDVNRICNQRRWIIWLKKRLNLMLTQDSTKVLLMKVLTSEWKFWRKFFWWKFWRKKWYSWRTNSCSASRI